TRESLDQPPTVVRSGCGNPLQGATSGEGPTPGKDFPEVLPRVPHSQVNGSGVVCRRHAAQGTALTYTAIRPRVPHDPEWTGTRCVARYHDVLWARAVIRMRRRDRLIGQQVPFPLDRKSTRLNSSH